MSELVNASLPVARGSEAKYWAKLTARYPGIEDDVQIILGKEVRRQRKMAGLTQIQLASQVFCSANTISSIERGYIFANMLVFNRICQHFKLMSGSLLYLSQLYCLYHYHLEGGHQT